MVRPNASINVDIGGTFTDCFVTWNDTMLMTKTPTTGYNLSVGFMKALHSAAASLNISIEELVAHTEMVRYSTTIAMNILLQRTGPRLGLICTEGFEDVIPIGKGSSWIDSRVVKEMRCIPKTKKPEPLIPRDMTIGLKERIDLHGAIIRPLDEEDFLEKLRYLVDRGARGFVICLQWSFVNPVHEMRIREIIETEYPDSYLGAMPVILSSEICPKRMEYTRMTTTILDAYLHESMWRQLCGMGDELRDLGYTRGLMMVHNSGGMAEVFRTSAIQTFNGGPVSGLIGGAFLGKLLGYDNVVVADTGGTSFDVSLVVAGSSRFYEFKPVIDRWLVDLSMLETKSIGAGGGSIAWLNPLLNNRIEVGPQSAGSMPGPAAYDLGGTEPTVTDADVVLGYINPDYYAGGKVQLNAEQAAASINEKIAEPLQLEVTEAAALIRKIVDANMGDTIAAETLLRGFDPRDFVLFASGGAGPTHCCGFASHAGIDKVVVFPFAPVYCAFGSSIMDTIHFYEQSVRVQLLLPETMIPLNDYEQFNKVVATLKDKAIRDITGEGLPLKSAIFSLELEIEYGGQLSTLRIPSPLLELHCEEDVRTVCSQFDREYGEYYSPYAVYPRGGVDIFNFILKVTVPPNKLTLPTYPEKGPTPEKGALKETRKVYWVEHRDFLETPIYEQKLLQHGNILNGPAVIEAENTTIVLNLGWQLSVDKYLNLIMDKL